MSNAVLAFLDAPVAAGAADRPAIVTSAGTTTYGDLLALAARAGHALRTLGVQAEQRVALLLPDGLEWAAVFLGALQHRRGSGADEHPSRPGHLGGDAARQPGPGAGRRRRVASRAAPGAGRCAPPARRGRDGRRPGRSLRAAGGGCSRADRRAGERRRHGVLALHLRHDRSPKAAMHLHAGILLACRHYGVDVLGVDRAIASFATSKLFFAYALGNAALHPALPSAPRTYLAARRGRSPAERARRAASGFAPTLFFSVPTFYGHLLRADLPRRRLPLRARCACRPASGCRRRLRTRGASGSAWRSSTASGTTETMLHGAVEPARREPRRLDRHAGARQRGRASWMPTSGRSPMASPACCTSAAIREPGLLEPTRRSRGTFIGEWFRTGDVLTPRRRRVLLVTPAAATTLQGGGDVGHARAKSRLRCWRIPRVPRPAWSARARGRPRQGGGLRRAAQRGRRFRPGRSARRALERAAPSAPGGRGRSAWWIVRIAADRHRQAPALHAAPAGPAMTDGPRPRARHRPGRDEVRA